MAERFTTCRYCNRKLAFIKYGQKEGKDGRIAKWPIYEKCPYSGHPEHTSILFDNHGRQISGPEARQEEQLTALANKQPQDRARGGGRLFVYDKRETKALSDILADLASRFPGEDLKCQMSPGLSDTYGITEGKAINYNGVNISFEVDPLLTPGYGYVLVNRDKEREALYNE